ncbi:MAG TPA: hypothetical protein PLD59_09780 [Tepidisphaeraceae bacterium]|nr:hypothetical protein [Tepidisphaeraceae bacterium]
MTAVVFVQRAISALESLQIPYVTVGSFAVNAYIEPRSTKDADFVVEIDQLRIRELVAAIGPDFTFDPQMSFESVTRTPRYKIRHREALFTIELFGLTSDPHDQARFARRVRGAVGSTVAYVLSPEDIVVTKLRWCVRAPRAKDREDIENVLAVHCKTLDLRYIRQWTDQHGTRALFEQLLAEAERFNAGQA